MFGWLKKWWMSFLANLAKQNRKQFGEARLDCCDLNRPKK